MTTPSLAHFVWLCTPSRGQHLRPGKAGSAVFSAKEFSVVGWFQ